MVGELTARRSQAFAGATSAAFPVLDADYVDHLLARLKAEGIRILPSRAVGIDAFHALGHLPEEMIKAIRQLQQISGSSDPDEIFPVIAATLRSTAVGIELAKVGQRFTA